MNDSMSILLATTVLALGGLGLYMYKVDKSNTYNDDDEDYVEDDYEKHLDEDKKDNDDGLFSNFDIFNWGKQDKDKELDTDFDQDIMEELDDDYDYEEEYKPRKRTTKSSSKTHKNKKSYGSSKRRY